MSNRLVRLVILLMASWCVMTFTHEVGHIVGGRCCGGTLIDVDLLPWHLPYSLFDPDPRPLVTLWSGPILGAVVPLGLASYCPRMLIGMFCLQHILVPSIYHDNCLARSRPRRHVPCHPASSSSLLAYA